MIAAPAARGLGVDAPTGPYHIQMPMSSALTLIFTELHMDRQRVIAEYTNETARSKHLRTLLSMPGSLCSAQRVLGASGHSGGRSLGACRSRRCRRGGRTACSPAVSPCRPSCGSCRRPHHRRGAHIPHGICTAGRLAWGRRPITCMRGTFQVSYFRVGALLVHGTRPEQLVRRIIIIREPPSHPD